MAALRAWSADGASRRGASIAYFTLFALAPMLLVVIAVAGLAYGQEAVRGELVGQIEGLLGHSGAEFIQSLLEGAEHAGNGVLAVAIGSLAFFLGSVGAFVALQGALNDIWRIKSGSGNGVVRFLLHRLRSFGMVMAIGFLLLISLTVNAGLAASSKWLSAHLVVLPLLWIVLNQLISFVVIALLFAAMFVVLPDRHLEWRDVWTGAAITAVLFTIGKHLIGIYLGRTAPVSGYGAAGSVVIVLIWVFYSAQIVLLGAEITRVVARARRLGMPAVQMQ